MDAQTAINQINARNLANNPMSVAELQTLAAQVDAKTSGATLLLNSGGVGSYNATTGRYEFSSQVMADALADGQNIKIIQ